MRANLGSKLNRRERFMSYSRSKSLCIHAKRAGQWLGLTVIVFLFCLPLFSQSSQGTIQGGVFDQSGGVIAGATVTVIDVARGVTRALTTDDAGAYVANNLTPGTYTVKAEAKGFRTVEHGGVLVEVGQNIRVDLVVQPGEQTQTVTVTGEIPAIDTTDATLGGTVSNQAINDLPLNGRNFQRLLQLRPGVVNVVGASSGSSVTNGRRSKNDLLRLEGIAEISDSATTTLLNAGYRGGDSSSLVPIDAIQEFSAQQNGNAEQGWKDGSMISVGVKSGTNSLHGTAYAFGRDASATDAANYFTGAVTPATVEQTGTTVGGPILKDKLFWFASFEALRVAVGNVTLVSEPVDVAGPGPASSMVDACTALGPGKINPLSAQLAGLNPTTCVVTPGSPTVENIFPYLTTTNTNNNFLPTLVNTTPLNNGILKADYVINSHHHVDGLYYVSKSQTVTGSPVLPQWSTIAPQDAQQYSGDWTWTPNSTWVNDLTLGYIHIDDQTLAGDANLLPSNPWPNGYGMNTGVTNPLYGGLPAITFTSFTQLGGGGGGRTGRRGPQGDVDLVDSVSRLLGEHAFKFGFEYLEGVYDGDAYPVGQGAVKFTTLESFLQGTTNGGSILLGNPNQNTRQRWYSAFFQDNWRVAPKLTLNLGLRYEFYASPVERDNFLGNFNPNVNPATTPAVEQFGPGAPIASEYNTGRGTIAPRLGVAWDVRGDGKTVIRAGGGIYVVPTILGTSIDQTPFGANFPSIGVNNSGTAINYNEANPLNLTAAQINWNTTGATIFPSTTTQIVNGVTYSGISCNVPGVGNGPCVTGGVNSNLPQPHTAEWNLDIQRALTNNLTLDVAYVGNHAWDEEVLEDLNQPPIGSGYTAAVVAKCIATPSTANCAPSSAAEVAAEPYSKIFPYLSNIDVAESGDFANYNSLQITFQARNYHGLSFISGYTFAHALSEADGSSTSSANLLQTDISNLRLNYGNSDNDLRHRFTFSPTYLIPGIKSPGQMLEGWSVNGIVTIQSGLPWTAYDPTVTDWDGTGEISNATIGAGSSQYWNYTGSRSAFTASANSIPCFGVLKGCTSFASAPAALAACTTAAEAPYAGNAQLQALALAALTNSGCYMQGGGILTPPAYGTVGDAGHGFFPGPNYRNVDFSLAKLWKLRERFTAQFRLEFFNLFNRADFGAVSSSNPTSGFAKFGTSTATPDSTNAVLGSGGPRHIQFGLKLTY
jgi:Carboxypeptidase regulatory-like domain